jgi:hypothetical protein
MRLFMWNVQIKIGYFYISMIKQIQFTDTELRSQ